MQNVLNVKNLTKIFPKDFKAVNNVSFEIKEGEILGLLGPNGAGKTTIIQMLLNVMTPTSGSIEYFGKDLIKYRTEILQNVSFASTYVKMPGKLTIYENIDIYGRLYRVPASLRKDRIEKLLKFFGMWEIRNKETLGLSAGQMTRVMLAKAFVNDPKIVLLDEPTASLDPDIADDVRKFILQQKTESGTSILLTSHNMDEVTEVCSRVLVLKNGTIIANNTPQQLAASVKNSRIHLLITDGIEKALSYVNEKKLNHKIENNVLEIEIDEHNIATLLNEFAKLGVTYDKISIDHPTLEDYFLEISRASKKQ